MYADANVAMPLVKGGDRWVVSPVVKTDRTMHAAGGLGTTARDLGRFLRLHLNGGSIDGKRILSEAAQHEMVTLQSKDTPDGEIRRLEGFGLGWQLGTYRGRPYATHGGGYIGTAAHISILPEDRLAVGILANVDSAPPLFDVVSIDVYDHLLGLQEKDLLPGYKQRALERRQEREARPRMATEPLTAAQLSLPSERYAGVYANEDWGTVQLRIERGAPRASAISRPPCTRRPRRITSA
jgi:CubicO group peptidase (beta-lactamase class C family)